MSPGWQDLQRLPSIELTETPFFPDSTTLCGPSTLATLIAAQGLDVDLEQLKRSVYVPGKGGAYQAEMVAALRASGLIPIRLQLPSGRVDFGRQLHHMLTSQQPVLVLQDLSVLWLSRHHYAVVVGYDAQANRFVLRSGDQARRTIAARHLHRTMARAELWAVVALSPDSEIPPVLDEEAVLEAAMALEATGLLANARWLYDEGIKRWPQNLLMRFGRANIAIRERDWGDAIARLRMLHEDYPDNVLVLNNLIESYMAAAEKESAQRWLNIGLHLPELDAAGKALFCALGEEHELSRDGCGEG